MPRPINVLLTGGTGGLGRAIAHTFAAQRSIPFHITLLGRNEDRLRNAIADLPKRHGGSTRVHAYHVGDITAQTFWRNIPWSSNSNGADEGNSVQVPTVLVNAAGVVHRSLLPQQTEEQVQETLDVNLKATIWACQAFAQRDLVRARRKIELREEEQGGIEKVVKVVTPNIINISSLLGTHGGLGAAAYAASKAGIIGLSRALAAEYGRLGIRVNTLVPGYIDAGMAETESAEALKRIRGIVPLKRLGTAQEVADAAMFLALNDYANNCVLNLDGGLGATAGS
ncbi:NAD(P)-binding protein [Microthyrium microscopicum]|uniref:NAD(P)-binding protein n=1 Tax=Microthyrium microscopicum TaxID=703497 RepID=A0A6A6U8V3_9PEZI|nr:NAD(P)-binding protein [Microthyrium microscopicum]